jgi:hypothetical protein
MSVLMKPPHFATQILYLMSGAFLRAPSRKDDGLIPEGYELVACISVIQATGFDLISKQKLADGLGVYTKTKDRHEYVWDDARPSQFTRGNLVGDTNITTWLHDIDIDIAKSGM